MRITRINRLQSVYVHIFICIVGLQTDFVCAHVRIEMSSNQTPCVILSCAFMRDDHRRIRMEDTWQAPCHGYTRVCGIFIDMYIHIVVASLS